MIKDLVMLFWAVSAFIVLLAWYKGKFKIKVKWKINVMLYRENK